jgi:hypothetical protein
VPLPGITKSIDSGSDDRNGSKYSANRQPITKYSLAFEKIPVSLTNQE